MDANTLIREPLAAVSTNFADRRSELSYLRDQADFVIGELNRLEGAGLKRLFIHGDATGGNANLAAGRGYTFFDFDCCGYGWQSYDLAVFRWSLTQNGKMNLWERFLDGYRSVVELDRMDEKAIDLLVAARNFWIMGYSLSRLPTLGSLSYNSRFFEGDVQFMKRLRLERPNDLDTSGVMVP